MILRNLPEDIYLALTMGPEPDRSFWIDDIYGYIKVHKGKVAEDCLLKDGDGNFYAALLELNPHSRNEISQPTGLMILIDQFSSTRTLLTDIEKSCRNGRVPTLNIIDHKLFLE